jgi:carboxylesterase
MEAVDIACGLGREVRVLGFSFGAVLAGWLAAMRPEVDQAVLVSPSFGLTALPRALRRGYAAMLPRLRDRMIWWDPALREEKPGPPHGYLWFSRRSIGELLRMGLLVEVEARHRPPAAREIWVVENPSDAVVDSHVSASLVARWRKQGACIHLHGFTAEDGLIHDLMDPMQPGQKVDIVYPVLRRILAGQIEGRRV